VGTHALLSSAEQARLVGYIVNKFRGDPRLFDVGIAAIGDRAGLTCFGVVPYFADAGLLPAEDSMALNLTGATPALPRKRGREDRRASGGRVGAFVEEDRVKIAVPLLPRIANFDDLDPLRAEPGVELI